MLIACAISSLETWPSGFRPVGLFRRIPPK